MTGTYDRRHWLKVLGVAAGGGTVTALAGCTSDGSDTTDSPSSGDSSSGSDGGGGTWAKQKTVGMTDKLKFDPDHVQVTAGTTVTWKNTSGLGHTVTAFEDELPDGATYFASGGADSEQDARDEYKEDKTGTIAKGETFSHTFETKGTYKYFCIPHEMNGMIGFVKVV